MKGNRLLLAALLLIIPLTAFGQAAEFSKAIKKNRRSPDGYYFVDLSRQEYKRWDIENFAKRNGYVIHKMDEGTISAYGNLITIVKSVEMLPKGESPDTSGSGKVVTKVAADGGGDAARILKTALSKGYRDGANKDGTYGYHLRSGISDAEMREACNRYGYHFLRSEKYWKDDSKSFIYFVPKDEMPSWVINHSFKFDNGTPKLQKGSVILFDGEVVDDIYWTGAVSGGMITGSGVGAKYFDDTKMLVLKGNFKDGKLDGEGYYRYGLPEQSGFFRIAGGHLRADGPTIMTTNHYIMTGAGEYGKTYPVSDGVIRMERGFYNWSENSRKPFTQYEVSVGRYEKGTLWGYYDENFKRLFNFPSGTFEEVRGFQNGKAIVKHTAHNQWESRNRNKDIWIEYSVDKAGNFSFSDEQKEKLVKKYEYTMEDNQKLLNLFKERFPSPASGGFFTGANVPERIDIMNETIKACKLDDPDACIAAVYPKWKEDFDLYQKLVRLYQLTFSKLDDEYEWDFSDKLSRARRSYEGTDYGYREKFNANKYFKGSWMYDRYSEGHKLVNALKENPRLNVPGKEAILDEFDKRMSDLADEYSSDYNNAIRLFWNAGANADRASELKGEQIDRDRSILPSKLEKHTTLLGGVYYTYDNNGTIYFKRGSDYVSYNIIYDEDMKVEKCEITYNTLKSDLNYGYYRTENDMLNAIVKAYIEKNGK